MNVLVTGGTGSLGSRLVSHLLAQGHTVTVLSRDPQRQADMETLYPQVRFYLTDICNYRQVIRACRSQDALVHTAALKQVHTGQYHPAEFTRVNIAGTETVAQAWYETHTGAPGAPALLISTDKAVAALNTYGATKKVGEAIFRHYELSVLRYGNVVQSRGAFLERWRKQIACGQPVEVSVPSPTRFFFTFEQALTLVADALTLAKEKNGIFIPHHLQAFDVMDVARATGAQIATRPLLAGEKQHELLLAPGECAVWRSNYLSEVKMACWGSEWQNYRSDNAPRIAGRDFLEEVGWDFSLSQK